MERAININSLSQKQLERLLDVTPMTIWLWRKKINDPLPSRAIPTARGRHRVYFLLDEVTEWLKRNRPDKHKLIEGKSYDTDNERATGDIPTSAQRLSA